MIVKSLFVVVLFLSVLAQSFFDTNMLEDIVNIGFIIPILLQRILFGHWITYKNNKNFWVNIFFSVIFIISAIYAIESYIKVGVLVTDITAINKVRYFASWFIVFNRMLFFFAILYLWNQQSFKKNYLAAHYLFRSLQIFYTITGIPVALFWVYNLFIKVVVLLLQIL